MSFSQWSGRRRWARVSVLVEGVSPCPRATWTTGVGHESWGVVVVAGVGGTTRPRDLRRVFCRFPNTGQGWESPSRVGTGTGSPLPGPL